VKPMMRDGLPYCSLTCDELRNYEGRRVCHLTGKAITPRAAESGVICTPYVVGMRNRLAWFDARTTRQLGTETNNA